MVEASRKPQFTIGAGGWLEATTRSAEQFVNYATELVSRTTPKYPAQIGYVFRGQPKSDWTLAPTLLRALPSDISEADSLKMESMAFSSFLAQAHLYVNPATLPPANQSSWLTGGGLMRHHLAPTRLLDWTESPYVAAYFAVSEYLFPGADGLGRSVTETLQLFETPG